jgi:hypothetical protein
MALRKSPHPERRAQRVGEGSIACDRPVKFQHFIAASLVAFALAAPARAAMLGDATQPFRAQRTVTIDGRTYTGAVFVEPGHQRHEQDLFGMHEVFLLDIAAARGILVLPSVKTFVAFPLPPLMAELDAPDLVSDPEGEAVVAGVKTTKYRIDHTAADGSRAQGHLWVSRADVLMKLDVTVTRAHSGKPVDIAMELSHVETGTVDPGLFAPPDGFAELPAEALEPLLGARPK